MDKIIANINNTNNRAYTDFIYIVPSKKYDIYTRIESISNVRIKLCFILSKPISVATTFVNKNTALANIILVSYGLISYFRKGLKFHSKNTATTKWTIVLSNLIWSGLT